MFVVSYSTSVAFNYIKHPSLAYGLPPSAHPRRSPRHSTALRSLATPHFQLFIDAYLVFIYELTYFGTRTASTPVLEV